MLRIAVPNKGTLSGPAAQMLREAGYRQRSSDRDLTCVDTANDVEFFYLRPRDIATYVGSGDLALGITGRDLLIDADSGATEIMDLDFAGSTLRFAARPDSVEIPAGLGGRRVPWRDPRPGLRGRREVHRHGHPPRVGRRQACLDGRPGADDARRPHVAAGLVSLSLPSGGDLGRLRWRARRAGGTGVLGSARVELVREAS